MQFNACRRHVQYKFLFDGSKKNTSLYQIIQAVRLLTPSHSAVRPKLKKLKDFLSMVFYWGPVQFLSFESQCTINFRHLSVEQHEVLLRNFIAFVGSSLEFFSSLRSPLNTLLLLQSRRTLRCRKTEKNNHHVNDSHLGDASSLCCL